MSSSSCKKPRHWTEEEDNLLRAAVETHGARSWKTIATFVRGRSGTQCLQRWNKVLQPGLKKGGWSKQEDHLLRRLVEQSLSIARSPIPKGLSAQSSSDSLMSISSTGDDEVPDIKQIDWNLISENIEGRSVKQCRERWCSNLDPNIKRGGWSSEEDKILLETQASQGNCWAHIARLLPGRTEHAVKTRFRSIMRAKKRAWSEEEDAKLIAHYKIHGSNWAMVAVPFNGTRTKNAVMTRFKQLQSQGIIHPHTRRGGNNTKPILSTKKPPMNVVTRMSSPKSPPLQALLLGKLSPVNELEISSSGKMSDISSLCQPRGGVAEAGTKLPTSYGSTSLSAVLDAKLDHSMYHNQTPVIKQELLDPRQQHQHHPPPWKEQNFEYQQTFSQQFELSQPMSLLQSSGSQYSGYEQNPHLQQQLPPPHVMQHKQISWDGSHTSSFSLEFDELSSSLHQNKKRKIAYPSSLT